MTERSREPKDQYGFPATHKASEIRDLALDPENDTVASIAGRILSMRDLGNLVFADLHDETGQIQLVTDCTSTPDFESFTRNNVGDWLGVHGVPRLTRRGEPSLFVSDWVTLARTEIPFPKDIADREAIVDPETRVRQRYLDLTLNRESLERFIMRSQIVSGIRRRLEEQGFLEVETPILQPVHGGAAARPFETHHNALDMELSLRIAPELYLKRLTVAGLQRVFEIGKVFRNEGISTQHNPEFTIMEVYAANWDYADQMRLTENLVSSLAQELHSSTTITYQGREVDLSSPWERRTMDSLVSEAVGEEVTIGAGVEKLRSLCDQHGIHYEEVYGPGRLLLELFEELVEDKLWGPIFVHDYPEEVSPLARSHRSRPGYTERFEAIVAGSELANAYTELNDAHTQYERFLQQESTKDHDDEAMSMDHDYIRALMYGMPPTAGLGIGVDRLVMLLTNASTIGDVVLFPTRKPDGWKAPYSISD